MRALAAIAGLIAGLAAAGEACAADLPAVRSDGFTSYSVTVGRRAPMLVIYDDEPGVFIRPYWIAPWRGRHYFPATGRRPKVGRRENLAARRFPKQAASFHRNWSTSAAFAPEWPRVRDLDPVPLERPLK